MIPFKRDKQGEVKKEQIRKALEEAVIMIPVEGMVCISLPPLPVRSGVDILGSPFALCYSLRF
jgi:hypothetical protein